MDAFCVEPLIAGVEGTSCVGCSSIAAPATPALQLFIKRREQTEIDIHRLKGFRGSATNDVPQQGAECRGLRRWYYWQSALFGHGKPARQQATGRGFDVSLYPCNLPGEAQARLDLQSQSTVEQTWAVDEGVAMYASEPCKSCPFKTRACSEDAGLFAML